MEETPTNKSLEESSGNADNNPSTIQIIIAILIIVVALGILIFAGYLMIKRIQSNQDPNNNEQEQSGDVDGDGAQDNNNPNPGWEVYVGNAFLINYPITWEVKSSSEKYTQFGPKEETEDIENVERIAIFIGSKLSTVNLPLDQEIEEFKNQSDYAKVISVKDTKVDGVEAKEILLMESEKSYTRHTIGTFFVKDGVVWEIRGVTYRTDNRELDKFILLYEEMLSSLKFIN